jgi:hypothetical protein
MWFEATWNALAEQVWTLPVGSTTPVQVGAFTNDNSPCVLPNGEVASLWLERPGNTAGLHEIKIMSADGATYHMALAGQDVADVGIGCGQ